MTLQAGDSAPDFHTSDSNGENFTLSDHLDRQIFFIIFPRVISKESIELLSYIRDNMKILQSLDTGVTGLSSDMPETLRVIKKEHNLNFHLLSDPEKNVIRLYGCLDAEDGNEWIEDDTGCLLLLISPDQIIRNIQTVKDESQKTFRGIIGDLSA